MSSFCGKQVKTSNIITDYENVRSSSGFYAQNHEEAQPSAEYITRVGPKMDLSCRLTHILSKLRLRSAPKVAGPYSRYVSHLTFTTTVYLMDTW